MLEQFVINVPDWFELNELNPLNTIISPHTQDVGVLLAGENFESDNAKNPIVRLYLINLIDGKYEVTKELESYVFSNVEEAHTFSKKLPNITALDLIFMLNKEQLAFS